jgi:hypothetical protein
MSGEEGERLKAGGCETEGFQPFFCLFSPKKGNHWQELRILYYILVIMVIGLPFCI